MRRLFAIVGLVVGLAFSVALAGESGLVLAYAFDEGSGTVLHDRSGHGNDGKIEGAQWVKAGAAHALQFDGQGARVVCPPSPSLNVFNQGTVEVWFKAAARQGGLISRHTGGSWQDQRMVVTFYTYHGPGSLLWCLADGAGFGFSGFGPPPALEAWSHVAVTFDGEEVKSYQDGFLTVRTEQNYLLPEMAGVPLVIGECEGLGVKFFKGLIGQVRIYDRVLSESEISGSFRRQAKAFGKTVPEGTHKLTAHATVFLEDAKINVEADLKEFLPIPAESSVEAVVHPSNHAAVAKIVDPLARKRKLTVDCTGLPSAKYNLVVSVKDKQGRQIGANVTIPVNWRNYPDGASSAKLKPIATPLPHARAFWIIRQGQPRATAVIPEKADETTKKAAHWLVTYVEKATGVSLPLVTEDQGFRGPIVSIGQTVALHQADLPARDLKWDGCRLVVKSDKLFLFGKDEPLIDTYGPEGTARAVVRFLQDSVGIRWLAPTPQGEFVPKKNEVGVPSDLDETVVPAFAYSHCIRPFGAGTPGSLANNFRVAVRVKSYGGHSYPTWLPASRYFKEHPEYFAVIDGKRTEGSHLCSTNPDVRRILLAGIQKDFDSGYDWVQLGQEDGYKPCECPQCEAMDNYDGTPEHPCERVLLLHKWIADECAKSHPNKIVHLLVYPPTVWPSKKFDKWRGNVVAELCNQTPEVIEAWKGKVRAFTGYVYWGDVTLPMGMGIHATPAEVAERVRFFHENDFLGLFQFPDTNWGLAGPAWYALGKLMGDPYLDYRALQHEYCLGLYGAAAETMNQFYNQLYAMPEVHDRVWPADRIAALELHLGKAEQEARGERDRGWVRLARDHFDYCKLTSLMLLAYVAYRQQPNLDKWREMKRLVDEFEAYRDRIIRYDDAHVADYFPGHGRFCKFLTAKYSDYYDNWKAKREEILTKAIHGTQAGWGMCGVSTPLTLDLTKPPQQ